MGKYDDIINMEYPFNTTRPRMPMEERAKIFLPFAALKGFEEAVERTQMDQGDGGDGSKN